MEKGRRAWVTFLAIVGGFAAFLFLLYLLRIVVFPMIISLLIAYPLTPVVDRLERRGIRRTLAALLLMAGAALVLGGVLLFVVPLLFAQFRALLERLPQYLEGLREGVIPALEEVTGLTFPSGIKEGLGELARLSPSLLGPLKNLLGYIFSSLYSLVVFAFSLALIPVYTFYILKDLGRLRERLYQYLPAPHRDIIMIRAEAVVTLLKNFVKGQLAVALIMGVLYSLGLFLLGVDFSWAVGLASGLLNVVPYLGLVVGLVTASIVTFLEFRDIFHLLAVIGLYAAVQLFEGLWLTPKIMGKSLGLPPLAVLVALVLGGELFGILGILLAVPATAVFKAMLQPLFEPDKGSRAYPS